MGTREITVRVPPKVAPFYESASEEKRRKLDALSDLQKTTFSEIWMADFTAIEASTAVALYAFCHPELSGNQHLFDYKKPRG